MSATAAVTPTNWNQIAVDYISPKTAAADINFRPTESGTDLIAIDPDTGALKTNLITTFSGSEISVDNKRIGDVATPTANDNATPVFFVQQGTWQYAISAGTAPNYTLTLPIPAAAVAVDGCQIRFKCHSALTSGTATMNVNGLGAVNIRTLQGTAISLGAFQVGGLYTLQYVTSLGAFVVTNSTFRVTGTTPTMTAAGAMSISSVSYDHFISTQVEEGVSVQCYVTFTTSGTPDSILYLTGLPIDASAYPSALNVNLWTGSGYEGAMAVAVGDYIEVRKLSGTISNGALRSLTLSGSYRLP